MKPNGRRTSRIFLPMRVTERSHKAYAYNHGILCCQIPLHMA